MTIYEGLDQIKTMIRRFREEPRPTRALDLRDELRGLAGAVDDVQVSDAALSLATDYDDWLGAATNPNFFDTAEEFCDLTAWPSLPASAREVEDFLLDLDGEDVFAD